MTKKEKKELASKNTKMTDWIGKDAKHVQPVQEQNLAMELDMDLEVAPDVDRAWRKMLAKSKTDEYRRLQGFKKMVSELVTDMVNSSEAESVGNNIMEAILYTSYVEG